MVASHATDSGSSPGERTFYFAHLFLSILSQRPACQCYSRDEMLWSLCNNAVEHVYLLPTAPHYPHAVGPPTCV
jgi:hypothetical protein